MRVLLITGNRPRHDYFIEVISKSIGDVIVFKEEKYNYLVSNKNVKESSFLQDYFISKDLSEEKYFKNNVKVNKTFNVRNGEINNLLNIKRIKRINPDYILLYGSSIVKDDILNLFPKRVLNLHLGLSPYFKGSGTNFWPIVEKKFSCIGVTFHLATSKVDGGPIICQYRPLNLNINDSIHDIGNKTLKMGIDKYPEILDHYSKHNVILKNQASVNKEYKRKDISENAVRIALENINSNSLQFYLENKIKMDKKYPIIKLNK